MKVDGSMALVFYFLTIFFHLSPLKYPKYVTDMIRYSSIKNMLVVKQKKKQTF